MAIEMLRHTTLPHRVLTNAWCTWQTNVNFFGSGCMYIGSPCKRCNVYFTHLLFASWWVSTTVFIPTPFFKSSNTRALSSMEYFFNPVFPMWELPEKSLCWEISLATNYIIKNTNVHNSVNCVVWSLPVRNYSAIYLCKKFNNTTK